MSFRIWGRLDGDPVSATWDGGQVSGSAALLGAAAQLVETGHLVRSTVTGPFAPAELDDGYLALLTLSEVLRDGDRFAFEGFEGEAPEVPPEMQYEYVPGRIY